MLGAAFTASSSFTFTRGAVAFWAPAPALASAYLSLGSA